MTAYKTILDIVARKKGFGRHTIEHITNSVFMEIASQLEKGETVDLGDFGIMKPSFVKEHTLSFNKNLTVPAHIKVTFSNSDKLKDYINGITDTFEIETKKPTH